MTTHDPTHYTNSKARWCLDREITRAALTEDQQNAVNEVMDLECRIEGMHCTSHDTPLDRYEHTCPRARQIATKVWDLAVAVATLACHIEVNRLLNRPVPTSQVDTAVFLRETIRNLGVGR